jgi:hypothetical protein
MIAICRIRIFRGHIACVESKSDDLAEIELHTRVRVLAASCRVRYFISQAQRDEQQLAGGQREPVTLAKDFIRW